MLLISLLIPVTLVITYLVIFPKTKGILRPLKVPANHHKKG